MEATMSLRMRLSQVGIDTTPVHALFGSAVGSLTVWPAWLRRTSWVVESCTRGCDILPGRGISQPPLRPFFRLASDATQGKCISTKPGLTGQQISFPRDKPISLLSIASSSSVACEQLFSAAGQIYADRRGNGENFMLRNCYIWHTIVVYSGSTVSSFSDYVLYILSWKNDIVVLLSEKSHLFEINLGYWISTD